MFAAVVAAALIIGVVPSPAQAFFLSEPDYDYLATQGVGRKAAVLGQLSPKEEMRLHSIINAAETTNDPVARA